MLHEPGVYFFMSAEEYHADPALGSSNIRDLIAGPRRYWLKSWMNPARYEDEDTKGTILGTALHRYNLEGREVFLRRYSRRPNDPPGATQAQRSAVTKKANDDARLNNKISLHGDEWDLVEASGKIITQHDQLKDLFVGGDHEVSVFWRDDRLGVPCKARFDILKPKGIGDIKTIANETGARLDISCKLAIKRYKYHIQAEHYLEARRRLAALVKAGKIYLGAGNDVTKERLMACAQQKRFCFVLVFISKALPEVWGCTLTPGNPLLTEARDRIDTALDGYVDMRNRLGAEPWPQDWRLEELDVAEMPGGEFGWN